MGLRDTIRRALMSPASRRLEDAAAEVWQSAPKASRIASGVTSQAAAPFSGNPQSPGRAPPINWAAPEPAPSSGYVFRPNYSDHTYGNLSAPLAFEGFDADRIDRMIAMHRLGNFYESGNFAVAMMSCAPLFAALGLATAPILSLRRHIHGGDKGLARMVAGEVEEQIAPRGGLLPSPYFPPELWGTLFQYLRVMGFAVLQHVDGEADPVTGVRARYTRAWDPWAVRMQRTPRKAFAITTEGEIEILNDGKFTLVQDSNEGCLFDAAILALGREVLGMQITRDAELSWLDFFGDPKIYLTMPEKIATHGEAGDAFAANAEVFYGPGGHAVFPYGTKAEAVAFSGEGSRAFREAILGYYARIGMILVGSNAPLTKDGGVYTAPMYDGLRLDLIRKPATCGIRGINAGHIKPYCEGNYGEAIERVKKAGAWKDPVLGIELPDPGRDARIESITEREKSLVDQIVAERAAGIIMDQDRVTHLAKSRELEKVPTLAEQKPKGADFYEWEMQLKLAAVDEWRERKGLGALPDGMGSLARLAEERAAGKDEAGKPAAAVDPNAPSADPLGGGDTAPAGSPPADGAEQTSDAPTGDDGPATGQEGGE